MSGCFAGKQRFAMMDGFENKWKDFKQSQESEPIHQLSWMDAAPETDPKCI